jgi:hypothetical protein
LEGEDRLDTVAECICTLCVSIYREPHNVNAFAVGVEKQFVISAYENFRDICVCSVAAAPCCVPTVIPASQ